MSHRPIASLPLRLLVLALLWVSAIVRPATVLACELEDAHYGVAAALDIQLPPDPDPLVDQQVHCCGHAAPLVARVVLSVPHLAPAAVPDAQVMAPPGLPALPPRRPPRQG